MSSPPSFAQSTAGKNSVENSQIKDKPSAKTPSPDSDITSNISLILTPSPDIINPTDNQDFQVPEENLKTGVGNDKMAGAGGAAAENSYLKDNSLITPNNQNKTNSVLGTSETTIKPSSVITPASPKKTASAGEPATANSYSKGKSLITASNQNKTNSVLGTSETTIKPSSVITPASPKNTSAITNGTGKQDAIGTNTNNTSNITASPNVYPNGNPIGTNATNTAAAGATTANITSNITAASNQNKTNSVLGTSETTIKPSSVITPASPKNTSAINDAALTGNNISSPQEANTKNPVKVSNLTSNKTGEQGSSAFPWLDQISKILGVK
jgi:hypothetical protein